MSLSLLIKLYVGLNILSTYIGSNTSQTTMSGTSMASPHTAGLLAYLLSLYPSSTFNPKVTPDLVPTLMQTQATSPSSLTGMYAIAWSAMPSWVATFLPPPELISAEDDLAPVPQPTLSPLQLKKALLALATEGIFEDLPSGSPNLLIFNNATTA